MLCAKDLISHQCFCCFIHLMETAPAWSKCSTAEKKEKNTNNKNQNTLPHYSEEPQFTLKLKMVSVGTHMWSASPVAASLICS